MWYNFFKAILAPACWLLFRPKISGRENIPESGGAILAANHISALDTIFIPVFIRPRVTFPAKVELFRKSKSLRHNFVVWFLKVSGQVPMDRSGGRASATGLKPVFDQMAAGSVVGIFPEGTRTPDGRLYRGRTGVARLATAAKVPVIPVGVVNTHLRRGPLGLKWVWGAEIRFGKPISYDRYQGAGHDQLRWVTDDVMAAIQQLTGQEYVDVYGSLVKHGSMSVEEADAKVLANPHLGKNNPLEVVER